jgi:hypothetical protein
VKVIIDLQGKKGDLGNVEVLSPQQSMHVVEIYDDFTILGQVEVLAGTLTMNVSRPTFATSMYQR